MAEQKEKAILSWSGGKDSALALHALLGSATIEIAGLLTTITEDYQRVSMHGIRRILVRRQAESIGLPLVEVLIPKESDMEEYEARMETILRTQMEAGVRSVVFGDIFLEDLRRYREEKLAQVGMGAHFPLWMQDSTELARRFIALKFKASVACVDTEMLDADFAGRAYDARLLADLPEGVDPCGENGEFHTFVYGGPIFRFPIAHQKGRSILREERFNFCDFVPKLAG